MLLEIIFDNRIDKKYENRDINIQNIEFNLTELKEMGKQRGLNMDLPTLSRQISKLIKEGYLKERREGREKKVSLTNIGLIFCPVSEDLK